MGKKSSSASLKRKRSKNSSKAKDKSKSKIRKLKSKKVRRRREDSLSSSDYDDSKSLDTSASSSSEDSYVRKRGRSRPRKDVKGSKKKARKRSRSCDSSEDSVHARKRKKAKRKSEYEVKEKEKPRRKKKIKIDASVSPGSCSTCQGGSAGSDDSQYESRKGRSERKEKGKQISERGRSGSEKSSRYRARSSSSCSHCSERSYERTEDNRYLGEIRENNSRRLRSVITVVKAAEECVEFSRNETKEEIVDDYDYDYPCRSNDSNDGGTKRELDHHALPTAEEKSRDEDALGDGNTDCAGTREPMTKKTSETSADNPIGDDLESILRQRALENLRKFRGVTPSTAKASSDQENKILSQVKKPITDNHDVVQDKSNAINDAVGTKFDNKTVVEETSIPVGRKNLIAYPRNNERLNIAKDISGSAKNHLACAPEKVIDADNPTEAITESSNYRKKKPDLTILRRHLSLNQKPISRLPQENSVVAESGKDRGAPEASHIAIHSRNSDNVDNIRGLSSPVPKPSSRGPKSGHNNLKKGQDEVKEERLQFESKQTSASLEPDNAKLLVTEGDVEPNTAKTTEAAIQSTNNSGRNVDELNNSATTKSCVENSSLENNSGNLPDESNQGSQFEQKTMTVMRGGEMVQVSYKVYIPKKTPALARRQFKR